MGNHPWAGRGSYGCLDRNRVPDTPKIIEARIEARTLRAHLARVEGQRDFHSGQEWQAAINKRVADITARIAVEGDDALYDGSGRKADVLEKALRQIKGQRVR